MLIVARFNINTDLRPYKKYQHGSLYGGSIPNSHLSRVAVMSSDDELSLVLELLEINTLNNYVCFSVLTVLAYSLSEHARGS